jgi:hypothetical protein
VQIASADHSSLVSLMNGGLRRNPIKPMTNVAKGSDAESRRGNVNPPSHPVTLFRPVLAEKCRWFIACRRADTDTNYTAGTAGEVVLDRGVTSRTSGCVEVSQHDAVPRPIEPELTNGYGPCSVHFGSC